VPPTTALRHVNPTGATAPASEKCKDCHTGHADKATPDVPQNATNKVEIRTRYAASTAVPTMNEQYSEHGYKIRLGGASTSGNTEAEMCWNCHGGVGISEWGSNPNTATGNVAYDYGSVSTPNWTTATWSPSALNVTQFAYKRGAIKSTHSVNFDSGQATLTGTAAIGKYSEAPDAVANIRCSYCHDVHDTRPVGTNEVAADVNGAPYLRGNWRGNPYLEDGAPFSTTTYTSRNAYGNIPRGGTQYTQTGGYYIDQNTPAASTPSGRGWTAIKFGGLCEKCHGNNSGAWEAGEIDGLDWRTGENAWVGTNGHSNSVFGAAGTAKANIFDYAHGRQTPISGGQASKIIVMSQGSKGVTQRYGYIHSSGAGYNPVTGAQSSYNSYNWGASVDSATSQTAYHKYSCSKCHNPHASRLPKLLITNCLDINHAAAWGSAKGSPNTYYTAAYDYVGSKTDPYYSAAQNCHRADDGTTPKTLNPGWNKVSPWGGSW
jgi:hypothetical protein